MTWPLPERPSHEFVFAVVASVSLLFDLDSLPMLNLGLLPQSRIFNSYDLTFFHPFIVGFSVGRKPWLVVFSKMST